MADYSTVRHMTKAGFIWWLLHVDSKTELFAGSLDGARRGALIYTLAQGCKLAGVEPFRYFKDVLLRVATHPASRIEELTPTGWAAAFAPTAA